MRKIFALTLLMISTGTCPVFASEKTFINSVGMEFVLIPSGDFVMGQNTGEWGHERPAHKVTISKPFYLGKYEVTQEQWEAVMGFNPYKLKRTNSSWEDLLKAPDKFIVGKNPATVSWNDAQDFIKRINKMEGHNRYRLPTEAEWEYAARAGTTSAYSFGDDGSELSRFAWHGEEFGSGSTHAVGQKEPNPWGLYDIHGNAWEWAQDWYDKSYYARSPAVDPKGPEKGSTKVVRGGSWHHTGNGWRSAFRRDYKPNYRGVSIGFRLALSVEE